MQEHKPFNGFGFADLTDDALQRLRVVYSAGATDIESGRTNYACGGYTLRQIKGWLKKTDAELARREVAA